MFTGLIQSLGTLVKTDATPFGRRLVLDLGDDLQTTVIAAGESIAVSGVCLTVAGHHGRQVEFDVVSQTLRATTLGQKNPGDKLNLELSLKAGDALGGHFVQGHVDGISTVLQVDPRPEDWRITLAISPAMAPLIIHRGSVAMDGVSMTIATTEQGSFQVAVIPTTLEKTTLGGVRPGDMVNIETDIFARTIVHYLEALRLRDAEKTARREPQAGLAGMERRPG